jgi:hypothetical protein
MRRRVKNNKIVLFCTVGTFVIGLFIWLFGDAILLRFHKSEKEHYKIEESSDEISSKSVTISNESENQKTSKLPAGPPTEETSKTESSYIPVVNIKSLEFSCSSRLCDFNIVCPQVSGLADKALQSRINEYILEKTGVKSDNLEKECKKYEKECREQKSKKEFPFEWKGNYKVRFNRNGILSLTVDTYKGAWGGHGISYMDSYNFDLNKGTMIEFDNFFAFQYKEKIWDLLKQHIKDEGYDESRAQDFQGAYLTENDIVVFYPQYAIGSGAAGVVEIPIPIRSVKKYLDPKGRLAKVIP